MIFFIFGGGGIVKDRIKMAAGTSSARSFLADAGYGEQELDANSALMELDKGLRSGKLGEQCEAVVRFPRLFQKYPFPILINSAFLKLADVFRVGNNFLRLCVLKVTQQSEKHLEKILNVDEFVKRIFSVIHSNDPVARAITLRMLGSMASIIPDRKNAHHSIRQSLDSHDNVEVEAAIFAASHFSAQSKDFAAGICNKIGEMIQGLATPVDLKLKLIPILQHMHHDAILASNSRQLLQQLVTSYPSTKMVIVTLHTFTLLAASSLVDIPKQIQLLLQYLKNDPRKAVKRLAIQDLKLLANKTPHTWNRDNIQALCECALQTPYDSLKLGMVSVLSTLSGSISIKQYFSSPLGSIAGNARYTDLIKLAQDCSYHCNRGIAAHGVTVLTNIVASCQDIDHLSLEKDAVYGLESLLVLSSQDSSAGAQQALKTALSCMVKLAKCRPYLSQSVVESLLTQLHSAQDPARICLCHCLASVAMQLPVLGDGMLGDLVELYKVIGRSTTDKQQELLVALATVIFVATKALSPDVKTVIKQQLENVSNGWTVYRIARQASRMGNHDMARELYQSLLTQVASEHFYFWLNSLKEFSLAEQCLTHLQEDDIGLALSAIADSLKSYHKGIASLTESGTNNEASVHGYLDSWTNAADHSWVLPGMCRCNVISATHRPSSEISSPFFQENSFSGSLQTDSEYERKMMSVFNQVLEEVELLGRKHPPVSYLHTSCLCNAVISLLKVPLSFQRYFFQKLQSTSIKLALSPSPRNPTEPIAVQSNQQMALKVEGVVQHGSKPGLFRKIQSVCLTVSSTLQSKPGQDYKLPAEAVRNEIEQRVEPHNDYFSTQFLLNLTVLGTHQITVEASVVDSNGILWKTGPKTSIFVKSLEDPYTQQVRLQQQPQVQPPPQQPPQRNAYSRF
ncbi:LOW QUALITY PROTEIN: integrator complex subunit 7 [Anomaloglossus baeobatrachus]